MAKSAAAVPLPAILVDRRIGSSDLYPLLQRRQVPCQLTTLAFGDAAFAGNGPHAQAVQVAIERKRIRDLVNSLLSNRLAGHQLPGIIGQYQYSWLVIEGTWRPDDHGYVSIPIGDRKWKRIEPAITAAALEGWILTLELRGGLRIRTTQDAEGTAAFLAALHKWWTHKEWAEHQSHLALYQPPDSAIFVKPTMVRQVAALLPGVGFEKSLGVEARFATVLELACASAQDWVEIPGIGKTLAPRIVQVLQEPK